MTSPPGKTEITRSILKAIVSEVYIVGSFDQKDAKDPTES